MTRQKKAHGAALVSCQRPLIILQIIVACLCYRNGRCRSRGKRTRIGSRFQIGNPWGLSVPPPRCQLKAPPSRNEREKGRAPAFVCNESMATPPRLTTLIVTRVTDTRQRLLKRIRFLIVYKLDPPSKSFVLEAIHATLAFFGKNDLPIPQCE